MILDLNDAACRNSAHPEAFTARAVDDPRKKKWGKHERRARETCVRCPVKKQCLTWAIEHNETGIWGGTDRRERQAMK